MAKKSHPEELIKKAIAQLPAHAVSLLHEGALRGVVPKVYVGMSGGVDSAVSAYLLKQAGFDVRGYFIKTWQPDDIECTWKDDRRDAMRVCAQLGIPFETVDGEDAYKQQVVEYMLYEYSVGRTPNPDIMCNKYVKFGVFYDFAMNHGADFVATGHYAMTRVAPSTAPKKALFFNTQTQKQVPQHTSSPISRPISGQIELIRSADENKDQTYFLWTIDAQKIAHTIFPVGSLLKSEVREIAAFAGLHVSDKKDSQGVCFIGKIDMKDFIRQYISTTEGDVLNTKGEVIGVHSGSILYTIGERHGFTLKNVSTHTEPHFVINKNISTNQIIVGTEDELKAQKMSTEISLVDVHYISEPRFSKNVKARIRHRQALQEVSVQEIVMPQEVEAHDRSVPEGQSLEVHSKKRELRIVFKHAQSGIASGQSCVLYDGEICLGGGIIA